MVASASWRIRSIQIIHSSCMPASADVYLDFTEVRENCQRRVPTNVLRPSSDVSEQRELELLAQWARSTCHSNFASAWACEQVEAGY